MSTEGSGQVGHGMSTQWGIISLRNVNIRFA